MKFIIYAPKYRDSSAGIRALYRLRDLLVASGYETVCNRENNPVDDETIVIYPEITKGNPLNAKRVVRYIMNIPGKIGGDGIYGKDDLLFAFSKDLSKYSNGNILTINVIEDYFRYDNEEKIYNLFYVGKGKNTYHPITRGATEITRYFPETRTELASLLKNCRNFYTYDDYTCLIPEALQCGCRVFIINGDIIRERFMDDNAEFNKEKEHLKVFLNECVKLMYLNRGYWCHE